MDMPVSAPDAATRAGVQVPPPLKAEARGLDFFYGTVQALKERQPAGGGQPGDRADRSFRVRQVHLPALLQPHARPVRRHPLSGRDHLPAGRHQHPGARRRPHRGAHAHRHGVPEAQSVPQDHLRERRLRPARARRAQPPGDGRQGGSGAARRGAVGRGEGPAGRDGLQSFRRAAAAVVHCPCAGDRTRSCCCSTNPPRRSTRSPRPTSRN